MGIGGISFWQLAIIFLIVLVLFGSKRLRGLGGDLGTAIKGFRNAMKEDKSKNLENKKDETDSTAQHSQDKEKQNS